MKIVTRIQDYKTDRESVVAIGKFDGVHMGHRLILERMLSYGVMGLQTVVLTFDKNPDELFCGQRPRELTVMAEKEELFRREGVDCLVEFPFTEQTSGMEPEEFLYGILKEKLRARIVVAGPDIKFGYMGRGDEDMLRRESLSGGPHAVIVEKARYRGREISSTYVKEEVRKGNLEIMPMLLGRDYSVSGRIVVGNQLGRTLGMPTVNLLPDSRKLLPPNGVYLSSVKCRDRIYPGISNVGFKPTVSEKQILGVETFIYNFGDDLYGEWVEVFLHSFVRSEKKFGDVEELKTAMAADIALGKKLHKEQGRL